MDTRRKVAASWEGEADIVEGFFDPLLAGQAQQLRALKSDRPLVVVVRDPPDPLMDAQARAELVAALRCVDVVLIGGDLQGRPIEEDRTALMNTIRAKHGR